MRPSAVGIRQRRSSFLNGTSIAAWSCARRACLTLLPAVAGGPVIRRNQVNGLINEDSRLAT